MHALFSSDIASQAVVILAAALLGWIACLRGQVHRHWIRQPDRVEQLAALPAQWCLSVSTVVGCL